MSLYRRIFLILTILNNYTALHTMSFDNRFIPLIKRPFITADDRPSHYRIETFLTTAGIGVDYQGNEIGITELFGIYNQQDLRNAMIKAGYPDPFEQKIDDMELITLFDKNAAHWNIYDKLQAQGFNIAFQQAVTNHFSLGFDWLCMHVNAQQEFHIHQDDSNRLTADNINTLDCIRRCMHETLRIQDEHMSQVGVGDIDLFGRFHTGYDYLYKLRNIQAGLTIGVLIPTGVLMDINKPASIPFGGNGHLGFYLSGDAEFELKEDWKVGLFLRVSKRFSKTCNRRVSLCNEPYIYGVLVAPIEVSPGASVAFISSFSRENIREGLGMRILYSIQYHGSDTWTDRRLDKTTPINLDDACTKTYWGTDYVTLNVFYDFGTVKTVRRFDPIVSLAWDVPVTFKVTKGSAKTHKVSLGVEFNF